MYILLGLLVVSLLGYFSFRLHCRHKYALASLQSVDALYVEGQKALEPAEGDKDMKELIDMVASIVNSAEEGQKALEPAEGEAAMQYMRDRIKHLPESAKDEKSKEAEKQFTKENEKDKRRLLSSVRKENASLKDENVSLKNQLAIAESPGEKEKELLKSNDQSTTQHRLAEQKLIACRNRIAKLEEQNLQLRQARVSQDRVKNEPQRPEKLTFRPKQPEILSLAWIAGIESEDFDYRDVNNHVGPCFLQAETMWMDNVGKFLVPKDEEEIHEIVDQSENRPRTRIATVVVKWPVIRDGNKIWLDSKKILAGEYEVYPWEFGLYKYEHIKDTANGDTANGDSLLEFDLKAFLNDKDPRFQDFIVAIRNGHTNGSILRKVFQSSNMTYQDRLVKDIQKCIKTLTPKSVLGELMPAAEIRQKMHGGSGWELDGSGCLLKKV